MRRTAVALATAIPRHVWDPTRHNPNWADSYGTEIADRRHWPAKKWSIGLEPRTPDDWRNFSKRNLAYAYNAALRSCGSFPEMIRYYQEMKQRGVKVDLDTMNTLLTRAARYEKIQVADVFNLYDEMVSLGARPDLATAETLHTVWDHCAGSNEEWREVRRQHLIRTYNALAEQDIAQYEDKNVPHLLAAQMQRYRSNIQQLGGTLSTEVNQKYLATITSFDLLLHEVNNYLWSLVPSNNEAKDDDNLNLRIPILASALKRPNLNSDVDVATLTVDHFQDREVCAVLLSAVERIVDHSMGIKSAARQRAAMLSLQIILSTTGVMVTSDLCAQLADLIKYSPLDDRRDRDATLLLSQALKGTNTKTNTALRRVWQTVARPCDARLIGRYIAARDPWSATRFCPQGTTFSLFAASETATVPEQDKLVDVPAESQTSLTTSETQTQFLRTGSQVESRWNDLQALIAQTDALSVQQPAEYRTEVFTGLAMFLKHLFCGQRLNEATSNAPLSFAPGMSDDVCRATFQCIQQLKRDLDVFCAEHHAQPELECWESILATLRGMMDFYVLKKKHSKGSSDMIDESFFVTVAELRSQMLDESRTRFDGRFRLLWLQEV